jgi:argininosuccinate lyase
MSREMDPDALRYTSSLEFDSEIFDAVIYVNIAHIRELCQLKLLDPASADGAATILKQLLTERPKLDISDEDIHVVIERYLSQHYPEVASMLSLGKSRNDAVVASIKLKLKERLLQLYSQLLDTVERLLRRSISESETIFPIYTHLQRALPATYGFILQNHALRLHRYTANIRHVIGLCDESPLGSAAGAGTDIPLDRMRLAASLGFERISLNALEATASRSFILQALSTLLGIAVDISSIAEEMVIYSSEEFRLLTMPDELSATSSIMPQKRNPVVPEIMRTKAGEILGLLTAVSTILMRQPSGYNLDLQQVTPKLWTALDDMMESLGILSKIVDLVVVDVERAFRSCMAPVTAVMLANHMTLKYGIPFRKAHGFAGRISRILSSGELSREKLREALTESGIDLALTVDEVLGVMEPRRAVGSYLGPGSSNPVEVRRVAELGLGRIATEKRWVENRMSAFRDRLARLIK